MWKGGAAMRKPIPCLVISSLLVVSSLVLAGPAKPDRYQPESLDQQLAQLVSPADGRVWSAWSYRNGSQYDIAVTVSDGSGYRVRPVFFGLHDGVDQTAPALAFDVDGNVYLAYSQGSPGRILLTALAAGADTWTTPVAVTASSVDAASPSLRVIGGRLALAFSQGPAGLQILDLPLFSPGFLGGSGFTDGPDPVGNTGGDSGEDDGNDDDNGTQYGGNDETIGTVLPNGSPHSK